MTLPYVQPAPAVTDFKPPRPSRAFIRLVRLFNRWYAMPRAKLVCEARDLETLRRLPPGVIVTPNHSAYPDAIVVTELGRRAGRYFNFMAARETFDAGWGIQGRVLQWLGGFSVNRGGENGRCQQVAKDVVKAGRYDLLIFPEGEIYFLNDLVMPFKPGVAMLALEVAGENAKEGRADKPVTIVPVAIKYRYLVDILPAVKQTVARLEATIFGAPRRGALYDRLSALGVELLNRKEQEFGLRPDPSGDLYARVEAVQKHLLETLERRYFGKVRDEFAFDRARRLIIYILEEQAHQRARPNLPEHEKAARVAELQRDLGWAQAAARSVSFAEDYLITQPTPERLAETLTKLEREISGREAFPPRAKRRATIKIGDPIDVRRFLPEYGERKTRKDAILRLVRELQTSIQSMIDALAAESGGEPPP